MLGFEFNSCLAVSERFIFSFRLWFVPLEKNSVERAEFKIVGVFLSFEVPL